MPTPITDRASVFVEQWAKVQHLAGDIAEFGCYNGGNTAHLAKLGRRVWTFDTFEGIPAQDYTEALDNDNPPGKFTPDYNVLAWIRQQVNINAVIGRFADTFPIFQSDVRFALAFVDCDLYESHKQCQWFLDQHMTPGGVVIFDDYSELPGAKQAIDKWVACAPPYTLWTPQRTWPAHVTIRFGGYR